MRKTPAKTLINKKNGSIKSRFFCRTSPYKKTVLYRTVLYPRGFAKSPAKLIKQKNSPLQNCSLSVGLCQKSRETYKTKNSPLQNCFHRGAGNRIRTDDLVLTKDALYLLSYTSVFFTTLIYYIKSNPLCQAFLRKLLPPRIRTATLLPIPKSF